MRQYNIEVFRPDFSYRSSAQVSGIEYVFDYMDIEKNSVTAPKISAEKGDYIRVSNNSAVYAGIISDVVIEQSTAKLSYKPLHKILDVNIFAKSEQRTVENTLAKWISEYYVTNADTKQNITGLNVKAVTSTQGTLLEESGVKNLFDLAVNALTQHGVMCDFVLDPQSKCVTVSIYKVPASSFVIEADLENVIDKNIIIKESDESVNKLTVYNKDDPTQCVTYYRDTSGNITETPETRILPVVWDYAQASGKDMTTFVEQALKVASNKLKPKQYDNLIEIEVNQDDQLVLPFERSPGQVCRVLSAGNEYTTVLTGFEIKENVRLIFGAIRLELTKQLKKRFRQEGIQ